MINERGKEFKDVLKKARKDHNVVLEETALFNNLLPCLDKEGATVKLKR